MHGGQRVDRVYHKQKKVVTGMGDTIIVALIGFAGSGLGALAGVIASAKLTNYRLQMLEDKVNKHNNLIERTFILEGQMSECRHDIKELKAYHRPIS